MQSASRTPRRPVLTGGRIPSKVAALCRPLAHVGPLFDRARFTRAGGVWVGMGRCRGCGSTIHESQLSRPEAA